ncbi:MAG: hypothetical protein AAB566_02350, partial [Patescibacteria group bacterium]
MISGDLEVDGSASFDGNVSAGTTNTNFLVVNSSITSHLIPFTNIYDIGSTTNRWRKIYVDSADITNLTAASASISGTVASDFTINSDNATSDTEDESVTFERGTPSVNAALKWDSTNNRFDFNFPVFLQTADAPEPASNFTKLILKGSGVDQGSNDYFEIQNSGGSRLFVVEGGGAIIASGAAQFGGLSVATASYSRFGTAATTHAGSITTTNDLLISGDFEVDGSAAFDGFTLLNNASVSGNFELTNPSALFGINAGNVINTMFEVGGTASISGATTLRGITYTWPSADGSSGQVLKTNGSGALSWGVGLASNSLDFDEFVNSMTLDANLTINRGTGNYFIGIGSAPSTVFEVQGTA